MTEKFPDIISPEGEEEKESAKEALKQWRQEGMKPIEGEREKTEREKAYIETINTFINRLFEILEIEKIDNKALFPEQVHIIDGETYEEKFPEMVGMRGFYRSVNSAIYIDDSLVNPDKSLEEISKFETILHESLHLVSHQKFYVKDKIISDFRVGYRMGDISETGRTFEGLNEGILVITEIELMRSFADELEEKFDFTQEQIEGPLYPYHENQGLVMAIAKKVAEYRDENLRQSLRRIMRGHFTGEMMHLRDIEKAYGEDSLKILARYDDKETDQPNDIILEYFKTADENRRQDIQEKVPG